MLESAQSFIDYRKTQENSISARRSKFDAFDAILTIEINITDLCNRRCGFCPRVDPEVYPNRKVFISEEIIEKVISELERLSYRGKVSFSGFGEPLLNRDFSRIINLFRQRLSSELIIETNTNGDKLTPLLLREIFDAGLNSLYWNLYDGPEQIEIVKKIITESGVLHENIRIRPHWTDAAFTNEVGLFLNNRSGAVESKVGTIFPLKKTCNYPFYKMLIDWNGDVLVCSNDWLRKKVISNVMEQSLDAIWLDPAWNEHRKLLLAANRSTPPCNTCDVDGGLFGESSVTIMRELL